MGLDVGIDTGTDKGIDVGIDAGIDTKFVCWAATREVHCAPVRQSFRLITLFAHPAMVHDAKHLAPCLNERLWGCNKGCFFRSRFNPKSIST